MLFLVTHNQTVWTLISFMQSSSPLFSSSGFGAPVNRDLFGFTISRALGFSLNEQHALVRKGGNDAILVNALQYQIRLSIRERVSERKRKIKISQQFSYYLWYSVLLDKFLSEITMALVRLLFVFATNC